MNKNIYLLLILILFVGCQSDWHSTWERPTDGDAPQPVTDAHQTAWLPGGATITYTKPADSDLKAIKAVYDRNEETKGVEEYSTTNSITLEGFNDTLPKKVLLYAVDHSYNLSTPVEVWIEPLENAINKIFATLQAEDAVGGFRLRWKNPDQMPVAVELSEWNENAQRFDKANQYVWNKDSVYSKISKLDFVRDSLIPHWEYIYDEVTGEIVDSVHAKYTSGPYQGVEINDSIYKRRRVSIRFMDRWENFSNSLDTFLLPLPEQKISPFDEFGNYLWTPYQGDGNAGDPFMGDMTNSTNFSLMFYDNEGDEVAAEEVWRAVLFMQNTIPGWTQFSALKLPIYITIDLGQQVRVSTLRFKCRERLPIGSSRYAADFEVWGSLNPRTDDSFRNGGVMDTIGSLAYWTGWDVISDHTINGEDGWQTDGTWSKLHFSDRLYSVLPSGIIYHSEWPNAELTSEDVEFLLTSGFTFELDQPTSMKYIRFKIHNTTDLSSRNEWQYLELKGEVEE